MLGRVIQPVIIQVKDKGNSTFHLSGPLETLSCDLCAAMLIHTQLDAWDDVTCVAVVTHGQKRTGETGTKLLHSHHTQTVYIFAAVSALQCSVRDSLARCS